VKIIVLDRMIEMKENKKNERVIKEIVMDIIRVMESNEIEVRKKNLKLEMEMV
jgi:hypothetical protein